MYVVMTVTVLCFSSSHFSELTEVIFTVHSEESVLSSQYTDDVYAESLSMCALMCLLQEKCCVASFSDETSMCRLDKSENCCVVTILAVGSRALKQNKYSSSTCTNCLVYDRSLYKIIDNEKKWQEAVDDCKCQGGKLIEIETKKENDFILTELKNRNTGTLGYWLGGYNFNNDFDLEWISNPGQGMPFDGTGVGEPNNPFTELCLAAWDDIDFDWADIPCSAILPYICEFSAD
ncbi:unnamed protein product [Mytilus edulis]|uniref:C-type lectin domain-containing protein n=1 Tax=Mytilus edulis TaxID=6550 RepID=A0A8S3QGM4_MYTED|nr:unnamed protein product [Mytilus edulis]